MKESSSQPNEEFKPVWWLILQLLTGQSEEVDFFLLLKSKQKCLESTLFWLGKKGLWFYAFKLKEYYLPSLW